MSMEKARASADQPAGRRAYMKPVLQAFGRLHLTTRGTASGSADGKDLGDKRA